jgi:hypothetical protein
VGNGHCIKIILSYMCDIFMLFLISPRYQRHAKTIAPIIIQPLGAGRSCPGLRKNFVQGEQIATA